MIFNINIRLYPTISQKYLLEKHANAYRFLYNLCLEYKIHLYNYHRINISGYEMQNELFDLIKEIDWMKGLKVECLRQAALDVEKSFIKFYKGKGYPKFKTKKKTKSFISNQSIYEKNGKLYFFRNEIKFRTSSKYKDYLKTATIKQCIFKVNRLGDWYASCIVDTERINKSINKSTNKVGIDLGLAHFLTDSNGNKVENPRFFYKSHRKLKKFQRKFAKTKKNSQNREKLRIKTAKIYEKITRQKEHFYHQVSNKLIFENQEIIVENLKIQNMIKNRRLSKSISHTGWGKFITILTYKCNWYGRKLTKVDTFYPSSKLCSNCGNKKDNLKLSDRIYKCSNCNLEIDRDLNAAKNLAKYSPTVKNTESNASGDSYKTLKTKQESIKEESKYWNFDKH